MYSAVVPRFRQVRTSSLTAAQPPLYAEKHGLGRSRTVQNANGQLGRNHSDLETVPPIRAWGELSRKEKSWRRME